MQKMRSPLSESKEMAFERYLGAGSVLLGQVQESGSKVSKLSPGRGDPKGVLSRYGKVR